LRGLGFGFERMGVGSHEIWVHRERRLVTVVPNHSGALPEGTVRAIVRQSGATVEEFLAGNWLGQPEEGK
jgi:predicted RNA binding protein YcfA (HicA-like mRNA interferase family)